jgi:hypothetical protein
MPQFLTIHRAPGLKREEFARNAPEVYKGTHATFLQSYVNLGAGFIASIYEAKNKDALEEEFERVGFPFDEIQEIQFSQSRAQLEQMLKQMGKL